MSVDSIKSEAELYLSSLKDQILPLQQSYVGTNGNYWQGIGTPEPPPEDGATGNPDPTVARQGLPSWQTFGATLPMSAPFAVRCDEEKWPDGSPAFVLVTYFGWDGGIWTGSIRYKGSDWEDLDWQYFKMTS
jgi:hypothetical protein